MQLSKKIATTTNGVVHSKPSQTIFELPEKVLQFGTGVLLRGLPDYFIDKANKQNIFSGRIVVVKSTDGGDAAAFDEQDSLYTQCIRGIQGNNIVDEYVINASISRVLSAKSQWQQILDCAKDPEMEIIISNTTEVGIVLIETDDMNAAPPSSFPGKLLAFLYQRYKNFNGDVNKGMVIVPTELITDNGTKLQKIVIELAHLNKCDYAFIDWLENANHFCNSLVDRIVPGKLSATQQTEIEAKLGYSDKLTIASEIYSLWAIESASEKVKDVLSFASADSGVIISNDINKFRELKLRLLNGTHTFSCGVAYLAGFETVKQAMDDKTLGLYVYDLAMQEMVPCVAGDNISNLEAQEFAQKVMDRFRNPFIEHKWISITLNYTHKMKMRNVPMLEAHYKKNLYAPDMMAMGFAAYILFMKCVPGESGNYYGEYNGSVYILQDEHAGYFHQLWHAGMILPEMVRKLLADKNLWGTDLSQLPSLATAVTSYLQAFIADGVLLTIKNYQQLRNKVESHEA